MDSTSSEIRAIRDMAVEKLLNAARRAMLCSFIGREFGGLVELAQRVERTEALLVAADALVAAEADATTTADRAAAIHAQVRAVTRDIVEAVSHDTDEARWYEPLYLLVPDLRARANALGAASLKHQWSPGEYERAAGRAKRGAVTEKPCEACAKAPVEFDEEDES